MAWSDTGEIQQQLDAALSEYQWQAASRVCDRLIRRTHEEEAPYPDAPARAVLASLRRKRQFALIVRVAEAFVRSGQQAPRVRRQYAQALIDQRILLAAEPVLQALAAEPLGDGDQQASAPGEPGNDSQVAEAHGLLGRIYKQLYVEASQPANRYARLFFERALSEYLQTYRLDPRRHTWHGINVVALLHRARVDGLDVRQAPSADVLAYEILAALPEPSKASDVFDLATRLEALVALGRQADAETAVVEYVDHPDADAFEINSTLRQFEEVWRLDPGSPAGSTILPVLRAARLRREGGGLAIDATQIDREIRSVQLAARNLEGQAGAQLERVFGTDRTVTLQWYETGLQRTKSIARVERLNGQGHGTGWLVDAGAFFPPELLPAGQPPLLLLTNAHVVDNGGTNGALAPDEARANFQGLGARFDFDRVFWSSPSHELDATFLTFKDNARPAAPPIPLYSKPVEFTQPPSRLYVIGHPGGRDIELSLNDNLLLGCRDPLLHYRTPTEGGSSGSPVFEAGDWRAVALHHAGGRFERLDGGHPPYDANEGISLLAIREAIKLTVT